MLWGDLRVFLCMPETLHAEKIFCMEEWKKKSYQSMAKAGDSSEKHLLEVISALEPSVYLFFTHEEMAYLLVFG